MNDNLKHYGVKGMKWGVQRSEEELEAARSAIADNDAVHASGQFFEDLAEKAGLKEEDHIEDFIENVGRELRNLNREIKKKGKEIYKELMKGTEKVLVGIFGKADPPVSRSTLLVNTTRSPKIDDAAIKRALKNNR